MDIPAIVGLRGVKTSIDRAVHFSKARVVRRLKITEFHFAKESGGIGALFKSTSFQRDDGGMCDMGGNA